MEENGGAPVTHYDGDGRNISEHIAAEKVNHVITHQSPSPDNMIIAFDTTPVIYDTPTDEQMMGIPRSNEKYQTREDAREGILNQFKINYEKQHSKSSSSTNFTCLVK